MKKIYLLFAMAGVLSFGSCGEDYDDSKLWNAVNTLDERVTALESQMSRMNGDVNSLYTIVNALQNNVYVTNIEEVSDGIYQIVFSDGRSITITNGKDGNTPYIGQNGNWWISNEDTGVKAKGEDGVSPHIGSNGNWWIGNEDTGVKAKGEDGIAPRIGQNGNWWIGSTDTGVKATGKDGLTPQIGQNGNWWIGNEDTGVKATGTDGETPYIGQNGNWWIGTTDTGHSAIASNGIDGLTPYIGENGNWWIGETDTRVPATGASGSEVSGGTENTPIISVDKYQDRYYWVKIINGVKSWLTDSEGNMLPVNGPDAVRPIIRVDVAGYWIISYDGGINFEHLTNEMGEWLEYKPCDCESFFSSIEVMGEYLLLIMKDGTVIRLRIESIDNGENPLSVLFGFDDTEVEWWYSFGSMPYGSAQAASVSINSQALPGGSSPVRIAYPEEVELFYYSIEGFEGFYTVNPRDVNYDVSEYIYQMTLLFSQQFEQDIHVFVGGRTRTGQYMEITDFWIYYHKAATGALQVSLSFDNNKDVDLHVITPKGVRYFYNNRGGTATIGGVQYVYGLDVDSNPACDIDGINNENISFPEEMIENGTYTVIVDMYENCDASIATNWVITARRGGVLLENEYNNMGNPVHGTYPVGAGKNDQSVVMKFTIDKAMTSKPRLVLKPKPKTESGIWKFKQLKEWEEAMKKMKEQR